ncbi:hypothetical protein [Aminobacter sp. AP02]|uniref:hypothetical protein n=1 Tax=Aminobacter sp. AP02 TaxID=2135737 RepID=UPI000D7B7D89|nr:hypothetical protein [Aminobacter sp. AP02]PWK69843.1 hypothetical protein C8K44_108142 [Aminobacter sp. AP02]
MSGHSENGVVLPEGNLFDTSKQQEQIREALEASFPNLKFIVTTERQRGFEAFLVIPIFGGAGQSRHATMMRRSPKSAPNSTTDASTTDKIGGTFNVTL